MLDPHTLRPLWTLDPEVHFLNHGSFGACPRAVLEHQSQWRAKMERSPVAFMARQVFDHLDAARERLAAFVRCDADGLVFVHNATAAVNAVLRSLKLEPGDELLITDHGYNACNNVARFVCERAGAVVKVASVPFPLTHPEQVSEAILAAASPRTRLALIDHITSPTGLVLPIADIVAALHERGIDTLVDGAHGVGQLDLDLGALGAAYYTSNCHKWLCAPKGAAFLHVRADRRDGVQPAIISHGANVRRSTHTRLHDGFDWPGTYDPSAWLSVPFAIDYLADLGGGWDSVRASNRAMVLAGRTILCDALGVEPPAPDEMIAHLVALPLPDRDPDDVGVGPFGHDPLGMRLYEAHRIEVPVVPWPTAPKRLVRISAQVYNDHDDYRALARALAAEGLATV